jgi:hypothetical protein
MGNPKGEPMKVRPYAGDTETVKELAKISGLDQMQILQMVLHAGLEAIKGARYRVMIPLVFAIGTRTDEERFRETIGAAPSEPAPSVPESRAGAAAAKLTGASPSGKKPRFER